MARVNINRTRSRMYARDWADERLVAPLTRDILNGARRLAPVKTGALRASLMQEAEWSPLSVRRRVVARRNYAYLVHGGAKPHKIRPRRPGGRLTFFWRKVGKWVNLAAVNHPGFKGIPYLQRPLVEYGTARRFKVIIYPHVG